MSHNIAKKCYKANIANRLKNAEKAINVWGQIRVI